MSLFKTSEKKRRIHNKWKSIVRIRVFGSIFCWLFTTSEIALYSHQCSVDDLIEIEVEVILDIRIYILSIVHLIIEVVFDFVFMKQLFRRVELSMQSRAFVSPFTSARGTIISPYRLLITNWLFSTNGFYISVWLNGSSPAPVAVALWSLPFWVMIPNGQRDCFVVKAVAKTRTICWSCRIRSHRIDISFGNCSRWVVIKG